MHFLVYELLQTDREIVSNEMFSHHFASIQETILGD